MNCDVEAVAVAETAAEERVRLHNIAASIPRDEDKQKSLNSLI